MTCCHQRAFFLLRTALKRLNWIWRKLIKSKISMSSTKFVFFGPIRKPRCGNKCGTLYSGAWYVALWASCLVPYRLAGGTLSLLAVCPSVSQSVPPSVWPSHFSFPDFSLQSLQILTWNLAYEFVMTYYRSSSGFVTLDLLLQELLTFAKIYIFRLFCAVFWDIDLKFFIWIGIDIIQIKFEFQHTWCTFTGVIALCKNLVFKTFLCSLLRYWLEIWYMNWFWHNTKEVWDLSRLTYFYKSYCPLLKFCFPDFYLQLCEISIWNLVWIGIDIIQIKFVFHHAWHTYTGVIVLWKNLVFQTFLCSLLRYWLKFGRFTVLTLYRSSSNFVAFYILSPQLLPFANI